MHMRFLQYKQRVNGSIITYAPLFIRNYLYCKNRAMQCRVNGGLRTTILFWICILDSRPAHSLKYYYYRLNKSAIAVQLANM